MENLETIELAKDKIRKFFNKKGVSEVEVSNKIKILNGTINFRNLLKLEYVGEEYPLPQTYLFSLEEEYVHSQFGVFTFVEVYDYNEKGDPIQKIVCEFILKGDDRIISALNNELINSFGFSSPMVLNHEDICKKYSISSITEQVRLRINQNLGNTVTIKSYPKSEMSNWFVKSTETEYLIKETLLNGLPTIKFSQLINDSDAMMYNFQSYDGSRMKDFLIKNFQGERIYQELTKLSNLDLEERFLGYIDLNNLSKSL